MLVNATKSAPSFHPLKLEITLQTEEEVQAFYALLNYSPVVGALRVACPSLNADAIRNTMREQYHGYTNHKWVVIKDYIERRI